VLEKLNMSEKKIVSIPNIKTLIQKPFALLTFKKQGVVVSMVVLEELNSIKGRLKKLSYDVCAVIRALASPTAVQKTNIFLLPFIVLISDKALSKNNLEVNI
jgi:predicted ribonuclease YlaK